MLRIPRGRAEDSAQARIPLSRETVSMVLDMPEGFILSEAEGHDSQYLARAVPLNARNSLWSGTPNHAESMMGGND